MRRQAVRRNRYNCHLCSFSSDSESKVGFHLETHVDGVLFYCDQCSYTTSTSRVLERHRKTHGNAPEMKEPEPPPIYSSPHLEISYVDEDPDSPGSRNSSMEEDEEEDPLHIEPGFLPSEPQLPQDKGSKRYKCLYCPYSRDYRYEVKRHERIHTGEKPYSCMFCDYTAANASALRVHTRRHHPSAGTDDPLEQKLPVAIDDIKLEPNISSGKSASILKTSLAISKAETIPKRNIPQSTMILNPKHGISKVTLQMSSPKPSVGNYPPPPKLQRISALRAAAAAAAPAPPALEPRILKETGPSPEVFRCGYCPFQHVKKQQVLRHMPIHTGFKPLGCNLCDYRTHRRDSLKLHMRSHEKKAVQEAGFSSEIVITSVVSLRDLAPEPTLTAPKVTETSAVEQSGSVEEDDKPHKCSFCPHRSKRRFDIRKHERIHTG